jgi:hypothetical protein
VTVHDWSPNEVLDDFKMDQYVGAPILTLQAPPFCDLRQATLQNVSTGSTATKLLWDTEISDTLGMHDTITNSDRVTINSAAGAGRYLAFGAAQFPANTTGDRMCQIFKNGTLYRPGMRVQAVTVVGGTTMVVGWAIVPCIVNDYVQFGVAQNSGGTLSMDNTSFSNFAFFQVIRVSD